MSAARKQKNKKLAPKPLKSPRAQAAKPPARPALPAAVPAKPREPVTIAKAKGRPMLSWVGKRPLRAVTAFPAQHVEAFSSPADRDLKPTGLWNDWPEKFPRGGLLFHGDNKEVMAHMLANGFRGKVDLIYIDPPFDSAANYVRQVDLRGTTGRAKLTVKNTPLGNRSSTPTSGLTTTTSNSYTNACR